MEIIVHYPNHIKDESSSEFIDSLADGLRLSDLTSYPPDSSEPLYGDDPSDVLIFEDNFDDYTGITTGGNPVSSNYSIHNDGNLDFDSTRNSSLATGRGGSGLCLQMDYFENQEGTHPFTRNGGIGTPTHFFYQYWFKTSVGWKLDDGCCGVKGVVFDLVNGSKYEHAVNIVNNGPLPPESYTRFGPSLTRIDGATTNVPGFVWDGAEDAWSAIPFDADDPAAATSPWPGGLNQGNWHRFTIEYKTGTNGHCKAWMDGVLAFDTEGDGHTYTAINGTLDIGWGYTNNWVFDGSLFIDDVIAWSR